VQHELSRLFAGLDPWGLAPGATYKTSVYPPLNLYREGDHYIVRAEIPGVDPKSIDLEVTGDTLTLRGERLMPEVPEGASYHRRERDFGQFRRSMTLPDRVDSSGVVANFHDGVLEIRLPQAEEVKARRITVQAS